MPPDIAARRAEPVASNQPADRPRIITIESLDQEARGVGHWDGKTVFVDDALPGEIVEFSPYRRKPSFEFARSTRLLRESAQRITPRCPHFGTCGGCSLQHHDARAQVAAKQRLLEDALWHIGKVRPGYVLPAIHGPTWGYRHRARLTVRNVPKKGGVLVGFHERRSSFVADMRTCKVLPERISLLLPRLRSLVESLSLRDRLPQIEVACGDDKDVLVLRILQPLTAQDEEIIRTFASEHRVQVFLQTGGPDSAVPFFPEHESALTYEIPALDLKFEFGPTEFTQVNSAINRVLVPRAMQLLAPRPCERVVDLFCGIGNFSLAIARSGADVVGFEGLASLIARASHNAMRNGLAERCRFHRADLFKEPEAVLACHGPFDRALIDPPRDGAIEAIKALERAPPARIVYVSCNPATLARDAGVLVNLLGYELEAIGVVNMFPHTTHVESIAAFDRK
jgi:23S rRNA (uracil1939-C5)-methyltransferase